MNLKKYKMFQAFLVGGLVLLAVNTGAAYAVSTHMLQIAIPPTVHIVVGALSLFLCAAGLALYASLLWFIRQFTDIAKYSAITLIIAHAATIMSLVFLQLNVILSTRLPFAMLFLASLVYRSLSDGRSIDQSLRSLCAEMDTQLLCIAIEERKKEKECGNR